MALACWGVVLVTRGRFRRAVTFVGVLAAAAGVAAVGPGLPAGPRRPARARRDYGNDILDVRSTGWFWIGAVASVLSLLAWLAAVRFVRDWPEMGRRYDAPSEAGADAPPDDLWKAMDQGHDPTS